MWIDPNIGRPGARVGSVAWAQHLRVQSQNIIDDAANAPQQAKDFVAFFIEHRAWTLLTNAGGAKFASFKEFCEAPKPFGWGLDFAELRRVIAFALTRDGVNGDRALAVATCTPSRRRGRKPGGRAKARKPDASPTMAANQVSDERQAKRYRAIAERAPAAALDLFKRDLLGVVEAGALGARNAQPGSPSYDPALARRVRAATSAALGIVAGEPPPSDATETRRLQRKVNTAVREELGRGSAAHPLETDTVTLIIARVKRARTRLTDDQQARLRAMLLQLLASWIPGVP
jgi:hypothetical protein